MKIWTVGTAWYLFQPILDRAAKKIERSTFYKYIKDLCDEAGVTRASRGIITGVRAELYFKGSWASVSLDSIGDLANKGTDVVFIEKQGVPEILTEWADKWGIAMVNTRGKLVEYAKDLMAAADAAGAHVYIMADYDASGIKIASEVPTEIPWIGANDKMLAYFNLDGNNRNKVSISSETPANKEYVRFLVKNGCHPVGDYKRSGESDHRFTRVDIDFIDRQRVELDAILAQVGDERFFEYIKDTLQELNPNRDYNRAIDVPTQDLGVKHESLLTKINDKIKSITESKANEIKERLKNVEGFLEVEEELKDIKEELSNEFSDDPDYKDWTEKLDELLKGHPFFKQDSAGGNQPPKP